MKSAWLKRCFTSTETEGLLGTGVQDGHLDFHTALELCKRSMTQKDTKYCFFWCTLGGVCVPSAYSQPGESYRRPTQVFVTVIV